MPNNQKQIDKLSVITKMNDLLQVAQSLKINRFADLLLRMIADVKNDSFTVLVCGEFSVGKSSLINSLVGRTGLLPVDVLPTTANIHFLRYGKPAIIVEYLDGHKVEVEQTPNALLAYTALKNDGNVQTDDTIKAIHISLESEILADGVEIVDTPGINDLNELRSEIVDEMIPRADLFLMLIDASTQMKKSEQMFIGNKIMKDVMPPLCIVANKSDQIDPDEIEDVLSEIRRQVRDCIPGVQKEHLIVLMSSNKSEERTAALIEVIKTMRRKASWVKKSMYMLNELRALLRETVENEEGISALSMNQIQTEVLKSRDDAASVRNNWPAFEKYLKEQGRERMETLINKSYEEMYRRLRESVEREVKYVTDPMRFKEKELPYRIEIAIQKWLESIRPGIKNAYSRYCLAMSSEATKNFGEMLPFAVRDPKEEKRAMSVEIQVDHGNDLEIGKYVIPGAIGTVVGLITGGIGAVLGAGIGAYLVARHKKSNDELAMEQLKLTAPEIITKYSVFSRDVLLEETKELFDGYVSALKMALDRLAEERTSQLNEILNRKNAGENALQERRVKLEELGKRIDLLTASIA